MSDGQTSYHFGSVKNKCYDNAEFKSIAMHYAGCSSCWLRIVGFLFNLFPYWALFLMPIIIEFHSYDSKAADAESSKNHILLKTKRSWNCWIAKVSFIVVVLILESIFYKFEHKIISLKCLCIENPIIFPGNYFIEFSASIIHLGQVKWLRQPAYSVR